MSRVRREYRVVSSVVAVVVLAAMFAVSALSPRSAAAFDNPALDDFYARTAIRSLGFTPCEALCDGEYVLRFLIGAQVANPSKDRLQPRLAEGLRLGGDAGLTLNTWSLTRTRFFVDALRLQRSGVLLTDVTAHHTTFYSTAEERYDPALHVSADALVASRTELQPDDFARLRVEPYTIFDAELEVAGVGPKIDKGGNLTAPVGISAERRLDMNNQVLEDHWTASGAIAFRGFPNLLDTPDDDRGRHYQFDFARLSHAQWIHGDATSTAWRLTAGYQRLSPGIPGFEVEILAGYGWQQGANSPHGVLVETSVEQQLDAHSFGGAYDTWYALDRRSRLFERIHNPRLFYLFELDGVALGASWEFVHVERAGWLHALQGRVSWHPSWGYGFGAGFRYRIDYLEDRRVARVKGAEGYSDQERFNLSLDWLF